CSASDCVTTSAGRPRVVARNPEHACAARASCVSYGNLDFREVFAGCGAGVPPVHLQGLAQRHLEALNELVAGAFLTVDARDLLNPADPPVGVLLDDRRVFANYRG